MTHSMWGSCFFSTPEDAGLQHGLLLGVVHLFAQVFDGANEEAAGAGGGVEHLLAQARVGLVHHELGDGARGVELARVARALQVAQDFFVQVVELVALGLAVEVHRGQLVDDLAQQVAAFHVVEGVFKHAAHHVAARVAHGVGAQAQAGEELVVEGVAGHAFGVRRSAVGDLVCSRSQTPSSWLIAVVDMP